jgi:hypothetical protein
MREADAINGHNVVPNASDECHDASPKCSTKSLHVRLEKDDSPR